MSKDSSTKKVQIKWLTDGNLAVIYKVENVLCFYSTDNDPYFKPDQEVTAEEILKEKPYKAIEYRASAIPSDAYRSLIWE